MLIETNWYKFCDQVWVVMLESSIAAKRLQLRDGLSIKEAESRLRSQLSAESRKVHADVVLKKVKPKVTGRDGLISLKIFAAIKKSAVTGKKIKI